jgi:ribosomal protein S12 methylthiotransferase accessory factor
MIRLPKFKDHLNVEVVSPDKVFVLAEFGQFVLTGRSCVEVSSLIDGRHETEEIVERLKGSVSASQVYYVLSLLETRGYITESSDDLPQQVSAFWHALGFDASVAAGRIRNARINVTSFGQTPTERFVYALDSAGLQVAAEADAWQVVITDDYLQIGLEEFNQAALRSGKPWFLFKPTGLELWLGPVFHPGQSGCWACLSQRLKSNRDVDSFLQEVKGRKQPFVAPTALPTTLEIGLNLAVTEIAKWVVNESSHLEGKIISFNTSSLKATEHVLVRRPQCPACGVLQDTEMMPAPVVINSSPKTSILDGGHRSVSAEATLQRLKHHVSPITGVVKQLERITAADDPLQHVYTSGQNMARKTDSYVSLRKNLRSASCGKGVSDVQAQVSAIGEAIERYSGVFRGDEPRKRASFRELGESAIDPRSCMLFSESQYRNREQWNARGSFFNTVPLNFDERVHLEWTPLWSLTREAFRYLPTSYCYYSYPQTPDTFFCLPDSNGSAAGNTIEEAILQGFLELVERDAVCLWWYSRVRRPMVDLESFGEPYVNWLRDYHASRHRELWVLDLTSDLGIPTYIALSRRLDRAIEDIVFAPASHLDPRIALLRALTELNQMMPPMDDSAAPGTYLYDDKDAIQWWRTATLENQPYLAPDLNVRPRRPSDYERMWSDDLRDDILLCQSLVEKKGLEMLVLNQTRPDIGLHVVKVLVPGLRHFWARFAGGRLYDVPLKLGWLDKPLTEDQMNPISLFI